MIAIKRSLKQFHKGYGLVVQAVLFAVVSLAVAGPDDAARPDWNRPDAKAVRARAVEWIAAQKLPDTARKKVEAIWADLPKTVAGTDLLFRLAATFAVADRRADALVEQCSKPRGRGPLPSQAWLLKTPADASADERFVSANLRLLHGRWLARQSMYDEAAEQLAGLEPEDVADPDSLLFFQAIVQHRLLKKDEALATVERLLQRADDCPRRYRSLARLMQADMKALADDTLDHVARRMDDVRRRLDLGRPGDKTRKIEDGIIESLDKLIKKLEQQQQQSASGGGGNNQPSNPAGDSQLMGGRGPGRVVKRGVGAKSGWGNLPAKDREEALQQVNREFPAHYREVIEQYFRKLADKEE
jgi:hypothetical protein